jgi:hypothetical protein
MHENMTIKSRTLLLYDNPKITLNLKNKNALNTRIICVILYKSSPKVGIPDWV